MPRTALRGSPRSGPTYEWALLEPIVIAAEAVERLPDDSHVNRGGRPRKQFNRPLGNTEALANGITMEGVYHEDGYSIRLRGRVVDAEMVDLLIAPRAQPAAGEQTDGQALSAARFRGETQV